MLTIVRSSTEAQEAINAAKPGDIIRIVGTIDVDRLIIKGNIIIEGEGPDKSIIKSNANSGGGSSDGSSNGILYGNGLSNVEIRELGFATSATGIKDGGHGDGRIQIFLKGCSNVYVHDCELPKYAYNDFARFTKCTGVKVERCSGQSGHDFLCFYQSKGEVSDCDIVIQTNCGIRFDGSSDCEFHNNNITGVRGTGWCMVELENSVSNINIHHNIFHDYQGSSGNAVTQDVHASISNVQVHDNVIWNCGAIKVGTASNNIINPTDKNIINWESKGYGIRGKGVEEVKEEIKEEETKEIKEEIIVGFKAEAIVGNSLKILFTSDVKGKNYLWETGDGSTSKHAETCTYTFKKAGTYNVKLTVDGVSVTKVVTVPVLIEPVEVEEEMIVVTPFVAQENDTTVFVAMDGSGKFNCDGKDDQVEISAAVAYAVETGRKVVYMRGPATYVISSSIKMGGAKITGDSSVRIACKRSSVNDLPYF